MIKLIGCVLCYNESYAIPYIMPYFERMGFDKLVVYDNESTDNSVELLQKYPFVEVRTFKTDHKHNLAQSKLKSDIIQEFKNEPNTWLFAADFDEVLYYPGNFKEFLNRKSEEGYTYLNQDMFELFSDTLPDLSDNKLIHEKCELGSFWGRQFGHKTTLLKLSSDIKKIEYAPGAHSLDIYGNFNKKALNNIGIFSFHIKYIDKEFMRMKNKRAAERRSAEDIARRFGYQYESLKNDDYFYKDWNSRKSKCIKTSDYLNNRVLNMDYDNIKVIK